MKKFIVISLFFILLFAIVFPKLKPQKASEEKPIQAIILPHHGLAKEALNNGFRRLKEEGTPETIVIFGTNHYFPKSETFTTTEKIKEEFQLDFMLDSDERIAAEHSIQTLTPYIKEYFPETKVIPIIISTQYESISALTENSLTFTKTFGKEKTLYIASVDFAHNVSLNEGLDNNSETIEAIKNYDINKILTFTDSHIDSPLSIITLMLTMKHLGSTNWETWYSTHGALITNLGDLEGTSYVVGVFR